MPASKRSTAIPFTATRISKPKPSQERQVFNDSRREGKLRIVTSKQGVRFFYMGKDSRITMADVSEISPEEAWSQADQWAKLEKEGFKVTRKSIQNLAKVASLTGEATELTMVMALRQRSERQFAAGKMRDITRDGWLRICKQAEAEEVNLFLIPVENITPEMVIDWFTGFCDSKGRPTANKWAAAFQTAYSDLLTLKVLKGENPFKVLSNLKLTSKTNTDKNPIKPEDLGKFICCMADCCPPEKFIVQRFLMFFLLHTGLRPDVLYRARIEHFDFEGKKLAIPRHKRGSLGALKKAAQTPVKGNRRNKIGTGPYSRFTKTPDAGKYFEVKTATTGRQGKRLQAGIYRREDNKQEGARRRSRLTRVVAYPDTFQYRKLGKKFHFDKQAERLISSIFPAEMDKAIEQQMKKQGF